MRVDPLFAEGRALPDAEAVLLVDDREREPLERDALLDQRMRPDDDVERPVRERFDGLLAGHAGDARREQRDARSLCSEDAAQRAVMLLRE